MEGPRIAWGEGSDNNSMQEWTVDELGDQFQKALQLFENAEEEREESDEEEEQFDEAEGSEGHNAHNDDMRQGEEQVKKKVSNPYKNKYMARVLLVEMKGALSRQLDEILEQGNHSLIAQFLQDRLHAVSLQLGLIAIAVQEPSTGEEHFTTVVGAIHDTPTDPRHINLCVSAYNQLGLLWAERFEYEKAKAELLKASEAYKNYRDLSSDKPPIAISDLFLKTPEEEKLANARALGSVTTVIDEAQHDGNSDSISGRWSDLENLHTYTLYYLAQVCGHLSEHEDAARYCHATLHRQLADTVNFSPLEWSKNAAFLASFYYARKNYKTARYLLSSSWAVLTAGALSAAPSVNQCPLYEPVKADVAALLGNYCLKLLQDSEAIFENGQHELEPPTGPSEKATAQWEQKLFVGLDPEKVSSVEHELPCDIAKDYSDATVIFKAGLRFLQSAVNYYTLEDHASRNTEVVQNMSRLYQSLASFETAPDRQSKMHKRRVDMLTNLLNELNPQYYLQACRQLRYELAETYGRMAACKESDLSSDQQQRINKVNALKLSSIKHYQLFLDSFKSPEGDPPKQFPEEAERAALVAYFHLGRLWSKLTSNDRNTVMNNLSNSVSNFKMVLDYVQRNPESKEKITEELPLCQEMVELLPYKLQRISAGALL